MKSPNKKHIDSSQTTPTDLDTRPKTALPTSNELPRGWFGIYKLIEEMGELNQALGKLGQYPDQRLAHPDGGKYLDERIADEVADVYAALDFFMSKSLFRPEILVFIHSRRNSKLARFNEWHEQGIMRGLRERCPLREDGTCVNDGCARQDMCLGRDA